MKRMIFLVLISNFLFAEGRLQINVGPNFSSFLKEKDSDVLVGYTIGIKYEYFFLNSMSFTSGLLYSKEGAKLNKIIKLPSVISMDISNVADVFFEDVYAMIGYLKVPLLMGYSIETSKKTKIKFFLGSSLLIPIKDYSYSNNYRFAFTYIKGQSNYNFEYYSTGDESGFNRDYLNYSVDVGLSCYYKRFFLSFEVDYHTKDYGFVGYISEIKKKLISGKFFIGLSF